MSQWLITGGTGLVGDALRNELYQSDNCLHVFFLSSRDCDLTDKEKVFKLFDEFQPTHVVHLAARVGGLFDNLKNNAQFLETNLLINTNVLSACNRSKSVQKVVSCMSTCIFPDGQQLPLRPEFLHNGLPHISNMGYSFAKRIIDVQNRIFFSIDKPFLGLIPANMFGENDNFDTENGHVIPSLIHKCYLAKRNGTTFFIKGSGNAKRQFLYAKDFAKIIILFMKSYNDERPVIIAPPEEQCILDVANAIAKLMNFTGPICCESSMEGSQKQQQVDDGQMIKTADGHAFRSLFTDFQFTPFDVALKDTVIHFLQNVKKGILRGTHFHDY
ncbi:GDP-L-fucose synthetase [Blyttiomyces helicus]|uniref:GDP-L-fucose synthetase n=1 Tax=Blyttiomyces helicus TaxID=388810 RepID=A0A4P9WAF2_9FUNG|nr:GDP-L-fucose synthetase [Blyttiomyces helicus]|eukprot:RKO89569.1 GDP-L-fucose synthetase [Blyttiomyces helicus]